MARVCRLLLAGTCALAARLDAQPARPVLSGPWAVSRADSLWSAAESRGTRSHSGEPGARYWVQSARYELHATLDPEHRTLRASGRLRYRNRSPDTLHTVALGLAQNLFRAHAPHNESVPVTGGVIIDAFCIARMRSDSAGTRCMAGEDIVTPALHIDNTIAWLALPAPLLPGDSLDIEARWHFVIPDGRAPRMGTDGSVTMIGYWYPQFCVYDDMVGWQVDPYLAAGEFYMDPADYDVRITVPSGMLVAATGTLENANDVLSPPVLARLDRAARSDTVVPIVTDSLRLANGATRAGALTWRFRADSVRDFAFYASQDVAWDAIAAHVPRATGGVDTVLVHALYRTREHDWRRAASYGKQSIEHFSQVLWPYPWPQVTLVEGVVNGGMEYPMLSVISASGDAHELMVILAHEVAHMWFPMQVGSDERRFAWMDEGLASWLERSFLRAQVGHDDDDEDGIPDLFRTITGMRAGQSMLTHADHYSNTLTYAAASYDRLVVVFRAFAAEFGDTALQDGLRAFGRAWSGRHPYPADFYRLVFAGAGDERDAFVRDWIWGTGHFDARIDDVVRWRDTLTITISEAGGAHLSLEVEIARRDGTIETVRIPASTFRRKSTQVLKVAGARTVSSITLDPSHRAPDLNRANERWAP